MIISLLVTVPENVIDIFMIFFFNVRKPGKNVNKKEEQNNIVAGAKCKEIIDKESLRFFGYKKSLVTSVSSSV